MTYKLCAHVSTQHELKRRTGPVVIELLLSLAGHGNIEGPHVLDLDAIAHLTS